MRGKMRKLLLLSPLIIVGALFAAGVTNIVLQSLGYIPAYGLHDFTLDYYKMVAGSTELRSSFKLSFYIALVSASFATVLGTLLCVAIVKLRKGGGVIKIPIVIPHTVVALFVIQFFSQSGLLARVIHLLGAVGDPSDFPTLLYQPDSVGIILAYLWKEVPFVAYFTLSLMQGIDTRLGETAENLGASKLRTFFNIVLPLSMPSIKRAFFIIFAFAFGAYELPFLLGATVPKALPVQSYIEYMHPDLLHRPYAMAVNVLMLATGFIMAIAFWFFALREKRGHR